MTAPQTNEIRNGVRFRNAALCAAFGALSAMSFIVSGENYQGISDPPASSASYLWCALALCFALLYYHGVRAAGSSVPRRRTGRSP